LCELSPERLRLDVVGAHELPVELDDGKPLAVARLELGVARDVDLAQLEPFLGAQRLELRPRALAEMAPGRAVENDLYG
jgi:hypothetical protein